MDKTEQPTQKVQLAEVLKKYWGYESFHDLQLPAMSAVLENRDSLVVLPTGGGKSLCYQAPAMCQDGMAIVVSPLISLMKDQVDALNANGISAAYINSTLSNAEKWNVSEKIQSNDLKLLYLAPERIGAGRLLDMLTAANVSFIAIDEAHCISQWGHDFRPHYRELKQLRDRFQNVNLHAYTATATQRVRDDIAQQLGLRDPEVLIGNFDRPNLYYRVAKKNNLLNQIQNVIERHPKGAGVVYCISRKEVERVTLQLQGLGYRAASYHAGMSDEDRAANQDAFIKDDIQIIVATVAFGMGIDKPDVRFVIHTGIPKTIENYQQETGRAGRDGLESECHLFFGGNDFRTWKMIMSDQPPAVQKVSLASLQTMLDYCHNINCRHRSLVQHFGQELNKDCETACDVCMGEVEVIKDSLKISQMVISSVYRQQERYGMTYTSRVLKGASDERIIANNHTELSTYGLLQEYPLKGIQDWIGQLVGQGFLYQDESEGFSILKITESGKQLLKGEVTPRLTVPTTTEKKSSGSKASKTRSMEGVDTGLFEALRELRTAKSKEKNVPPYVVFGDAALIDMARRCPSNEQKFLEVQGVGQKKCEEYSEAFLGIIQQYCEEKGLPLDVDVDAVLASSPPREVRPASAASAASFPFFEQGLSIEEVAEKIGRARSTTEGYLTDYLRERKVTDPRPWVEGNLVSQIESAIEEIRPSRLKLLYLHFEEKIDYTTLKIVSECYRNREQ
ncbi:DNA helicase RecQ [Thalassoglobus polymorphus]|uniref:DNA helicase RecQ n=1 Tax=Thalassoglobus polymorphus TaxID=2527994 RepID=A0A517QV56_9PLAN|nr:DNA helicase RecQ [Thalassoglobus polymorphus]QDT35481.1 ATP-dependent DNA helicase RecQ [Thalassoglobus polymorphus]